MNVCCMNNCSKVLKQRNRVPLKEVIVTSMLLINHFHSFWQDFLPFLIYFIDLGEERVNIIETMTVTHCWPFEDINLFSY